MVVSPNVFLHSIKNDSQIDGWREIRIV
jgi:hypothetical protein